MIVKVVSGHMTFYEDYFLSALSEPDRLLLPSCSRPGKKRKKAALPLPERPHIHFQIPSLFERTSQFRIAASIPPLMQAWKISETSKNRQRKNPKLQFGFFQMIETLLKRKEKFFRKSAANSLIQEYKICLTIYPLCPDFSHFFPAALDRKTPVF